MLVVVVMTGIVSWLDWITGPAREPTSLYEVPILVSAVAFGVTGALVSATVCSASFLLTLWLQHAPYYYADVTQTVLFYLLGLTVGQLVTEYLRGHKLQIELLHLNAQLERRVAEAVAAEREAQQKLRDAQRLSMLGEAAAQIAHEIKNPLVSIGGYACRVQKQIHHDHPAHSELSIIAQEVTRLEVLLGELLDLANIGCRERDRIDVTTLVKEVVALVQPPAQEQRIDLVYIFHDEPFTIIGDSDQLRRALLNVVLNGVEAIPQGGKLNITVSSTFKDGAPWVNITVQDTGVGIPSEHLSRIFEPFFTTKRKGTGLGLALVKKIVDSHGGSIEIESKPQIGTSVTMWLPAALPPEPA